MKLFAVMVATIILTGGSLQAQDVMELAEEVKKMQQQILTLPSKSDSLERTVTELRGSVSELRENGRCQRLCTVSSTITSVPHLHWTRTGQKYWPRRGTRTGQQLQERPL